MRPFYIVLLLALVLSAPSLLAGGTAAPSMPPSGTDSVPLKLVSGTTAPALPSVQVHGAGPTSSSLRTSPAPASPRSSPRGDEVLQGPRPAWSTSTVYTGSGSDSATWDPTYSLMYVTDRGSDTVTAISGTTVVAQIPVISGPTGSAYDPENGYLYATNYGSDFVSVIGGPYGTEVISNVTVGSGPVQDGYDAADKEMYVLNRGSDTVSVIGGLYGTRVLANITVGANEYDFSYDAALGYVDVTNQGSSTVSVISGTTLVGTVSVDSGPSGLAWDPSDHDEVVPSVNVNFATLVGGTYGTRAEANVSTGSDGINATYDGSDGDVYVSEANSDNVSVLSGASVAGSVGVGITPADMVYDGDDSMVFVCNSGSDNVTAISGLSVAGWIPVGADPNTATWDPANATIFVTNYNSGTVTVITTLNVATPTATVNPVEAGEATTLTTSANGGSGTGYVYTWSGLPPGCSGPGASISCTPTPGTSGVYSVVATVTDSLGASAQSGPLSLTVTADPTVSVSPAGPLGYDVGQTASALTATVTYSGKNTATVEWYSSATFPCSSSSTNTLVSGASYTPSVAVTGMTVYCAVVSDSGVPSWASPSNPVKITVNATLTAGAVTPSSPTIDLGQSIALTSNEGGGSPAFHYQWYSSGGGTGACNLGASISGATGATYSPSPASTGYYCYQVTDSSMGGAETAGSTWDLVTVNPKLVANAITPSAPTIDVGQSVTLHSNAAGGTAPYSYLWYSSSSGSGACDTAVLVTGATSATLTISPASTTNYCYEVFDGSGGTPSSSVGSAWAPVTVNPALTAGAPSPSAPTIDVGQAFSLSSHAVGGTAPYSIQWYSSSSGTGACDLGTIISGSSGSGATLSLYPTSTTYYCYVLGDSSVGTPTASASSSWDLVTVNTALAAGTLSSSGTTIDLGQTVTLTVASPSGGTAPFTYQWLSGTSLTCSGDAPVAGQTGTTYTTSPSATTDFCVEVGDSSVGTPAAMSYSNTVLVTVDPALTAAAPTPGTSWIDTGQSIALTAHASGGTVPYGYQWYASSSDAGSCASGTPVNNTAKATVSPTSSTYYCYVLVDSSGGSPAAAVSSTWASVVVGSLLSAGALSASALSIDPGQSDTLTELPASGGTSPYAYSWVAGSSSDCSSDSTLSGERGLVDAVAPAVSTYYCVSVSDNSTGSPAAEAFSNSVEVVVNAPFFAGDLSPVTSTITPGQSVTLTDAATGGATPYSYAWALNGTNASSLGTSGSVSQVFDHEGTYTYQVWVRDARGDGAWSTVATVNVVAPPSPGGGSSVVSLLTSTPFLLLLVLLVVVIVVVALVMSKRRRRPTAHPPAYIAAAPPILLTPGAVSQPDEVAPEIARNPPPTAPEPPMGRGEGSAPSSPSGSSTLGSSMGYTAAVSASSGAAASAAAGRSSGPVSTAAGGAPAADVVASKWPQLPLCLLESGEPRVIWNTVASSKTPRSDLLIITSEASTRLEAKYGLSGATIVRLSAPTGEGSIAPGDVPALLSAIKAHLVQGKYRAVVLADLDSVLAASSVSGLTRLLHEAKEAALKAGGMVLAVVDPEVIAPATLRQLEDDAAVLRPARASS